MRRYFNDKVISAGALLIVLAALIVADGRVRAQVSSSLSQASSPSAVGGRVQQVGGLMLTTVRSQAVDNAPLVVFVAAASVLVVFMLRL